MASPGKSTAVLDIDPQHSLVPLAPAPRRPRRGPAALALSDVSGWRVAGELDRLRREHDVVLVDTPPVIDNDARRAIRGADLVMVPVQPSAPDIWAAEGTFKSGGEEKRPVCVVLNRVPATGRQRAMMEAGAARTHLIVLAAALGNRAAFSQAFARGWG